MKSKLLKRPMFRMGDDENVGIMDGMRQRYSEAGPVGTQQEYGNLALQKLQWITEINLT